MISRHWSLENPTLENNTAKLGMSGVYSLRSNENRNQQTNTFAKVRNYIKSINPIHPRCISYPMHAVKEYKEELYYVTKHSSLCGSVYVSMCSTLCVVHIGRLGQFLA